MKDYLGIRGGGEDMAGANQFGPQLGVVENFAVEDNPVGASFIADRLPAIFEVDDAEPHVSQAAQAAEVNTGFIRAAMAQRGEHSNDRAAIRRLAVGDIDYPSDSTHRRSFFLIF